jgi:hypothetical protein
MFYVLYQSVIYLLIRPRVFSALALIFMAPSEAPQKFRGLRPAYVATLLAAHVVAPNSAMIAECWSGICVKDADVA